MEIGPDLTGGWSSKLQLEHPQKAVGLETPLENGASSIIKKTASNDATTRKFGLEPSNNVVQLEQDTKTIPKGRSTDLTNSASQ